MAPQIVTCFALHAGDEIVSGGSFQVLEEVNSSKFYTSDGCALIFTHSYWGATCSVAISCEHDGSEPIKLNLAIPINRTKKKWKQTSLGPTYELYYRSGVE
jgi:hypothetical protein